MSNFVMFQGFEWYCYSDGTFFTWMIQEIEKFKELGITAIWLPPFSKATSASDVGYGIYDYFDLGEFNQKGQIRTKYGTKDDLLALVQKAHENQIKIYADIILNHKAGADYSEKFKVVRVNPENRLEQLGNPFDIEGFTGFNFPGRKGKYSKFIWNFNHFTGVDYDELTGEEGIYKILGENKDWSMGVSFEKGNYDYLMFADIDHAHPEVKKELMHYSDWLVETTGVDGFRLDALGHINDLFMKDFVKHTRQSQREDFYVVGEYWTGNLDLLQDYLKQTDYEIDLFDVALHFNFYQASLSKEEYDLRTIFDETLVQAEPQFAVTFVDNHDSQPDQALSSWVEDWFKPLAYGCILLRKDGYPCVFFGDYYGIGGERPIPGKPEIIENLLYCRKKFAYGDQTDYFDSPNAIAWVRHGDKDNSFGCVVILSNKDEAEIEIDVGQQFAGKSFVDALENYPETIEVDNQGLGIFKVLENSISCWVLSE